MPINPEAVTIIRDHVLYDPLQAHTAAAWQQLPELPAAAELLDPAATTNDLPPFPVDRSFDSKGQYLEALYKILRFEAVEGLRFSINEFKSNPTMNDDQNTCVYTKVFVKGYLMTKLSPICRISFSTRRAGRKVLWKQAKRLTPGRIVALSSDNFQSDCRVAIVAQRPIEGGLDQNPPTVDIIWGGAEEAIVDPDHELVMLESRNGFYEAARHAMIGLQLAAGESSNFEKYLHHLDSHDTLSRSVASNPTLDLSCLVTQLTPMQKQQASGNKEVEQIIFQRITERYQECDMTLPLSHQDIQQQTSLDSSQLEALERIVSKELAVIQGPPGTGKTFTSVQALKAILTNRRLGDPPVIVSAQTNHALDQLLIYCHAAGANILRVGGRTENEVIKERTIYNLRMSLGKDAPGDGKAKYRSLEKERLRIVEAFKTLVDGVFGGQALLDPQALLDAGVINEAQFQSLSNDEWEDNDEPAIQAWLGEERIERIRQPPENLDFTEEEAIDEPEFELSPDLEDEKVDEEDDPLHGIWIPLTSSYTGNTPRIPGWQARCITSLARYDDLYQIPVPLRGGVYQILQSQLREASTARFREILQQAVSHAKQQKVNKWFSDLSVLEKHCIGIIGCTTTGLTKYRGFLAATRARVLLIEEAAETREPNVTSALFPSLDQLILVGDHQQLPPHCDIARLGGEPFNLNVSLFERLVQNRIPYTMLDQQRRMAPELRFIVQKYYPDLKDHPLVKDDANRPLIPGMGSRRSWFFTHEWPEGTDADNSKFNPQEARMIVAFMKYLVQNGVRPAEITVLTYYRGQRKRILQLLRHEPLSLGTSHFNVATVDSYQGEENEIVLLSLVRSPPTPYDMKRVGFVDSLNRATVAISRARRGFFMFGNKENLFKATIQSFDTWAPVWNGFAEQQRVAMGKGLPLVCQNHKDEQSTNEIWMKSPDDFVGNAGGCWTKCDAKLPCGHNCVLNCHVVPHEKLSSPVQSRDSSPEKWVEFSRNPEIHDNVIRRARIQAMQPLIELDTPPTSTANASRNTIKERWIPISNRDGQERLNQRRQQQPVPPNNSPNFEARGPFQSPVSGLEALAPVRVQAAADSISLMGESDLGFEAEVLGIRRSRRTGDGSEVNVNTVPGQVQEGMDIVVESLVSFGGDGAVSPAKPASSPKKDEEEELLIDFD
ncbi:suppressor of ascus dominance 3 [Diaporthe ampelina]|uniref:Suppressor of ascus dominance 3 n=1 Tax=Diaporthe ampelina TaxID=1214573 RepID=A0A0G2FJM7_9PEZI|nr:suppressor of ascus dominance 3 [Diaporthe ampelina]